MITNEKLYGKGVFVPPIPKEIVDYRVALLKKNLESVMKSFPDVDNDILSEIQTAIKLWNKLGNNEEGI